MNANNTSAPSGAKPTAQPQQQVTIATLPLAIIVCGWTDTRDIKSAQQIVQCLEFLSFSCTLSFCHHLRFQLTYVALHNS